MKQTINANLARVQARIAAACERAGRDPQEVTLVAVTKTRTLGEVRAAYACGLRDLGENRVEELAERNEWLQDELADDPPRWHMIGHIQSRKALDVVLEADLVHSLDSIKLAERLNRFAAEAERVLPVYVEFNVSGEDTKYGLAAWDKATTERSFAALEGLESLGNLQVCGLMTMAPYVAMAEQARPVFRRLRELSHSLHERLPFADWQGLSMGMTNDYEVAIEEGATVVRIGRAIFGLDDRTRSHSR